MHVENIFGSSKTGGLFDKTNYVDVIVRDSKTKKIESIERSNLIVYHGRSWLAQRCFAQSIVPDWSDRYINLFCVGSGGSTEKSPLTEIPPSNQDLNLYQFATINSSAPGNPNVVTNDITTSTGVQEVQFLKFDSKALQADPLVVPANTTAENPTFVNALDPIYANNIRRDAFVDMMIQVTLKEGDALDTTLNEAGLYVSTGPDSLTGTDAASLFARVTFSSILKTSSREILFKWVVKF